MGQKLKFVLSDLHIGAGYAKEGSNPLEDFTASAALVEFLHDIWHESESAECEIELIINGDLFEFLQVPAVDDFDPTVAYPKDVYLDSSEKASIKRLNIIAEGHPDVFNALSDFMHVEEPQRRITIIKGNHDVHLFWPGVKKRLREILGASGTRASLLRFANEFVSREKIYVEHGHQRAEKTNNYPDSYDPRSPDDLGQIYYPAGSHFVIDFLNDIERNWWFVDNIKPIPTLIWYALSQNFDLASKGLISFINHSLALNTNLISGDTNASFASALLQELKNDNKRNELSQHYTNDPAFRQQFHQKIQRCFDEIRVTPQGEDIFVSGNPVEMGRAYQIQQQAMLRQAAEAIVDREGAKIVLFGHTHHPIQEPIKHGNLYINTGSWIENFFDVPLETWEALFDGLQQPGDTLLCLPYARIDYDEHNNPTAQLLYFNREKNIDSSAPIESAPETAKEPKGFFEKNFYWIARFLRAGS